MVNRKTIFLRLIVLAAALCLVLVGISCKKKPTEAGGMELSAPDDKNDVIGGDGSLTDPTQIAKYKDEFINIRLISDSGDGEAYYRAPVVVTYGANGMGMGIFYERRFGQGGVDDVGVDGKARVDIVFMANAKGGDNLHYSSDTKVGSDPSASTGSQYSKGSPVVFAKGNNISVVASSGAGAMPIGDRGVSEIKISKGTASGDTISFGGWEELNIKYTPDVGTEKSGSEAIREYVKKIGDYNSLYTRWGQGKMDSAGTKWVLPLKFRKREDNGSWNNDMGGILILYSEDGEGKEWKFGPYIKLNDTGYADAIGLSVNGNTVKLALTPLNPHSPVGIFSGTLSDYSSNPTEATGITQSGIQDSQNNFEMNAPYFINTRERSSKHINGFLVNKKLTITLLNDPADDLQANTSMLMSRLSGSGSVAVLSDGTILTVAEEAFAENAVEGENRFNLVQRRFTKDYLTSHERIPEKDEYYNKNYPEGSY